MKSIEVFDPAMCCSTGVCGPNVDPVLPRFAADLSWLSGRGVNVQRFNLAQQPGAFTEQPPAAALRAKGEECLPLVLAEGEIVSEGRYPSRTELAHFAGVEQPASVYSPAVAELVAVGAALASNCEPCLEHHVARARELGVADEEIAEAVKTARMVKETPARSILRTAEEMLGVAVQRPAAKPLPVVAISNNACCADGKTEAGSCC